MSATKSASVTDEDDGLPSEVLNRVSRALMLVAKGDPLVSFRSEMETRFESIEKQFRGINRATDLVHDDYVRVPTQVDKAVAAARDLLEQRVSGYREIVEAKLVGFHGVLDAKIDNVSTRLVEMNRAIVLLQTITDRTPDFVREQVAQLRQMHDEKMSGILEVMIEKIKSLAELTSQQFKSINDTFSEKDKAVSVGLSAQKESATATQDANSAATAKMEDNFTTLINQGRELLTEFRRNTEMQLQDIKSRLDKREGMANVADPAIAQLILEVRSLRSGGDRSGGEAAAVAAAAAVQRANSSQMVAIVSAMAAVAAIVLSVIPHLVK